MEPNGAFDWLEIGLDGDVQWRLHKMSNDENNNYSYFQDKYTTMTNISVFFIIINQYYLVSQNFHLTYLYPMTFAYLYYNNSPLLFIILIKIIILCNSLVTFSSFTSWLFYCLYLLHFLLTWNYVPRYIHHYYTYLYIIIYLSD